MLWEAVAVMSVDGFIAPYDKAPPNRASHGGWTSDEDKEVLKERIECADAIVVGHRTWEQSGKFLRKLTGIKPVIVFTRNQSPADITQELSDHHEILVCGGANTYSAFAYLIDMWTVVTEPVLMGRGVKMFGNRFGLDNSAHRKLYLVSSKRLNNRGTTRALYTTQRNQ